MSDIHTYARSIAITAAIATTVTKITGSTMPTISPVFELGLTDATTDGTASPVFELGQTNTPWKIFDTGKEDGERRSRGRKISQ